MPSLLSILEDLHRNIAAVELRSRSYLPCSTSLRAVTENSANVHDNSTHIYGDGLINVDSRSKYGQPVSSSFFSRIHSSIGEPYLPLLFLLSSLIISSPFISSTLLSSPFISTTLLSFPLLSLSLLSSPFFISPLLSFLQNSANATIF